MKTFFRFFGVCGLLLYLMSGNVRAEGSVIQWAKIQGPRLVQAAVEEPLSQNILQGIRIFPNPGIDTASVKNGILEIRTGKHFRLDIHYYLEMPGAGKRFLQPDGILDSLYTDKPLGCRIKKGAHVFRVFAPRARWVRLVLFDDYRSEQGREFLMERDSVGVWEFSYRENLSGKFYGYRVWGPTGEGEFFDSTVVVADPYSRAVVTRNHYTHPGKTLILPADSFAWQGDHGVRIHPRDLIIYEMHVRDMTADPTSGVPDSLRGSYRGLIYPQQHGGLPYIRRLSVNAVELLPAQDFANIEIPYRDSTTWIFNTWNPYERNHWGYMTSYFFAPESYYASGGTMEREKYNGADGRQIREFKEMVRAFHHDSIAVIMDVVYNHVSQYDYNPLKYIDKFYYFRLKPDCEFESVSGCGNDLKTERPMVRRLIIESVLFWMQEYHIDGFRFDLANMIDKRTCGEILRAAQKINPDVILIAEPWGGGYSPDGFSDIGWASWNDQIRNGFKGWNPHNDRGFIFGEWQGQNNRQSLQRYVMGSLREFGGQYRRVSHSVNYLASHDDHTLGDFIRLALGDVTESQRITDLDRHVQLTPRQLKTNKLAALALFTSQGAVMIHEGQEFARSKVIAKTAAPDTNWGRIDHNSYEKDNPTNWLNFHHAEINRSLVDYYRGLIRLRKQNPAFRQALPGQFQFLASDDSLLLSYRLVHPSGEYLVALNGNPTQAHTIDLPEGTWEVLADEQGVYLAGKILAGSSLGITPTAGVVLRKFQDRKAKELE